MDHDKLLATTRVWVAQTFFGEMLRQMRNSPFRSDLMDGGRGGEVFAAQLDQRLAERMSRSHAGDRLVNSIVRRIERKPRSAAGNEVRNDVSGPTGWRA